MDATFRVSVRELVGFTYFQPDIIPGGNVAEMLAGTHAHQAREQSQAEQFAIEKPIRFDVEQDGECVTVYGRMDAYREGNPPCVDEIKLAREPPAAPLPEHLAQARLYGALVALGNPVKTVEVRVSYVREDGALLWQFAEVASRDALLAELTRLLMPWIAFQIPEREHVAARDESLRAMCFPFPDYRAGQRELAVQVYTAIRRKRRLFASLPTGTGKSAAVLFPALKALAEGKTRRLLYLTARATARQSPLNTLERVRAQGAKLRVTTVIAKEKLCPSPTRCHPDDCPRARGHFLRQPDAIARLLQTDAIWTEDVITHVADTCTVCPFELALALTELADVVLMDVNYAFDPFVQIMRLFKRRKDFTLLIDEAHHLLERVRDSLSGRLDTRELRAARTLFGKSLGRKHPLYRGMGDLLHALEALAFPGAADGAAENIDGDTDAGACSTAAQPENTAETPMLSESPLPSEPVWPSDTSDSSDESRRFSAASSMPSGNADPSIHANSSGMAEPPDRNHRFNRPSPAWEAGLPAPPENVTLAAQALTETLVDALTGHLPNAECRQTAGKLLRTLCTFGYAAQHADERYATLLSGHGRERELELYCLSPAETIQQVTHGLRGSVFFSATLAPLSAMRSLLGGQEEDACFSLPSPFPPERLAVVRQRVQTRYAFRQASAARVAQSIATAVQSRRGKYIAFFPSYAYLRLVLEPLQALSLPPLIVQSGDMTEEERARFLAAFTEGDEPKLGLCVLGGSFSEGVDLPGEQLIGALIVGVGLPTPSLRLKTLQAFYEERFGDGFLFAWMIPAMQKVAQAAGRVIRTEKDRGLIVLLDDRYYDPRYTRLLPPDWRWINEDIQSAATALNQLEEP